MLLCTSTFVLGFKIVLLQSHLLRLSCRNNELACVKNLIQAHALMHWFCWPNVTGFNFYDRQLSKKTCDNVLFWITGLSCCFSLIPIYWNSENALLSVSAWDYDLAELLCCVKKITECFNHLIHAFSTFFVGHFCYFWMRDITLVLRMMSWPTRILFEFVIAQKKILIIFDFKQINYFLP